VQLEKKERLQRALGEPTDALQFQQREAQGQKRRRDGWRKGLVDTKDALTHNTFYLHRARRSGPLFALHRTAGF